MNSQINLKYVLFSFLFLTISCTKKSNDNIFLPILKEDVQLEQNSIINLNIDNSDSLFTYKANNTDFVCQENTSINKILNIVSGIYKNEINNLPRKVTVKYENYDEIITGHAGVGNIPDLEIVISGTKCPYHLTEDATAILVCHEFGHLLGGYPTRDFYYSNVDLSAEGQADLFAVNDCLPKVFRELKINTKEMDYVKENYKNSASSINNICNQLTSYSDQLNCQRTAFASLMAVQYLYKGDTKINNSTFVQPNFETPDKSVVTTTNLYYPSYQCRLDTYLLGLKNSFNMIPSSEFVRPACWFKD